VIITGTSTKAEGDQLDRIGALEDLIEEQFKEFRLDIDFGAFQTFQEPDQWLITLRQWLLQGRRCIVRILFGGNIQVVQDPRPIVGGRAGFTFEFDENDTTQKSIFNFCTQTIQSDPQIKGFWVNVNTQNDDPQFNDKAQWFVTLLGWLNKNRQVNIWVNWRGQIIVKQSWRQPGFAGWRISTNLNSVPKTRVQQYNILLRLNTWLAENRSLQKFTNKPEPVTPSTQVFTVNAHWYITLVQLLKQNKQVEIEVDEDGFLDVRESKTQTGKAGYIILTDIKKITDVNSPQYQIVFNLQNFIKTQKTTLDQYITVTTTTTTTTTNQVGGAEAFLNALAKLIAEKRQFTITIRGDNTYDVQENQKKVGTESFFVVVFSTATPTAAQKDAHARLYKSLNTRPNIIKFDRSQKQDDPFNAVIKTTSTVTTTKTVKKTL
jgi:hypothetical protein